MSDDDTNPGTEETAPAAPTPEITEPPVPDAPPPEESSPVLSLPPPPPPEFGATHELVFADGTVEPLRLVEGGFVDRDGRFLLRGECDRHGTLRRVLPR